MYASMYVWMNGWMDACRCNMYLCLSTVFQQVDRMSYVGFVSFHAQVCPRVCPHLHRAPCRYDLDLDRKWARSEFNEYVMAFGTLSGSVGADGDNRSSFERIDVSGDGSISDWEIAPLLTTGVGVGARSSSRANSSRLLASDPADADNCSVYVSLDFSTHAHNSSNISLFGRRRAEIRYGLAVFTDLYITRASYTEAQRYRLRFTFGNCKAGVCAITSPPFHVAPSAPHHMVLSRAPKLGTVLDAPLEVQPRLFVEDVFGNKVSGRVSGWVRASLQSVEGQAGAWRPMVGNSNVTLENGVASFTDLRLKANGTFTMRFDFSDASVAPLVAPMQLRVPLGEPVRIALLHTQPNLVAGQVADTQPAAALVDANDNIVPVRGIWIQVSVDFAARASLTGTATANLTHPAVNLALFSREGALQRSDALWLVEKTRASGIARFTNLGLAAATTQVNLVLRFELAQPPAVAQQFWNGSNMTLAPAESASFNLTDPRGVQTLVLAQRPALDFAAYGGEHLRTDPIIILGDINKKRVDSDDKTVVNVSITKSMPCCGLIGAAFETPSLSGRTSYTANGGTVKFTDLVIDKIGKHRLEFSALSSSRASIVGVEAEPAGEEEASQSASANPTEVYGGIGDRYLHAPRRISVDFWLIVRAGTAHELRLVQEPWAGILDGQPSPGRSGQALAQQPAVILFDRGGNRISDDKAEGAKATVTAVLLKTPCSPLPACCGGVVATCIAAYSAPGLSGRVEARLSKGGVIFTDLQLNFLGSYSLGFFGASFQPAVSAVPLQVSAGAPARLLVLRQPAAAVVAGEQFEASARVVDLGGNLIAGYDATQPMLALLEQGISSGTSSGLSPNASSPGASPSFMDITAAEKLPIGGVAVFDRLAIRGSGACYTIRFTLGSLTPVLSDPVRVFPGEESQLIWGFLGLAPLASDHDSGSAAGGAGANVAAGEILPSWIEGVGGDMDRRDGRVIVIADKGGNWLHYASGLIQSSLVRLDNSSSATADMESNLVGTRLRHAQRGATFFTDLAVTLPGIYHLTFAKVAGFVTPISSSTFRVILGRPYSLQIITAPVGPAPGRPLHMQPAIGAADRAGNRIIEDFGVSNSADTILRRNTSTSSNVSSPAAHNYNSTDARRRWFVTAELLQHGLRTRQQLSTRLESSCAPERSGVTCIAASGGPAGVVVEEAFNGQVAFTDLVMNASGSGFTIRFTAVNGSLLPAVSAPLSVEFGEPNHMALLRQPGGAIAGFALTSQPAVMILDLGGNRILTLSTSIDSRAASAIVGSVGVRLAVSRPGGNQTSNLTDTLPQLVALAGNNGSAPIHTGLASFLSLSISAPVRLVSLVFSARALSDVISEPFAVTQQPTQMRLVTSKVVQRTLVGSLPVLKVQICDANGWVVEAEDTLVVEARVALPSITGAPVLSHLIGSRLLRSSKGQVVFTDLRLDRPFDNHKLVFVAPGLPVLETTSFPVYGPTHLILMEQDFINAAKPPRNISSGRAFGLQPSLLLTDSRHTQTCSAFLVGSCTDQDDSTLQTAANVTAMATHLFPSLRVTARIKPATGARGGKLLGNTTAQIAYLQQPELGTRRGFIFTDLAVEGPYRGYVLVFELSGLAWPVQTAESLPFDVQFATTR